MSVELILDRAYRKVSVHLDRSFVEDSVLQEKLDFVCRCTANRSCARLLMACLLAKLDKPEVDPRMPYTEIGGQRSFSGRSYDENYLSQFITQHQLPLNPTTAFLTPTFRNISHALTTDLELVGRPRDVYKKTLEILDVLAAEIVDTQAVFCEIIRILILLKKEKAEQIFSLKSRIKRSEGILPLSSESIITLVSQHLACKNSSRLPVLIVAAAYTVVGSVLTERVLPLNSHNAADKQTGALGDIEICLKADNSIVTAYEMKMKRVVKSDIDSAVSKITNSEKNIDNYIFITTDIIDADVADYAKSFYERLDGVEISILDCMGFLRHFIHMFHRVRIEYINHYQNFVLNEPESSVSHDLKTAFLALRLAAESSG